MGGGGRIAIGINLPFSKRRQMHGGINPAGIVAYTNHGYYLGALQAAPGSGGGYSPLPEKGTIFFLTTNRILTIEGTPSRWGAPAPQGYGTVGYQGGTIWITNSVVTPANSTATQRWQCIGWQLRTLAGTPVSSGTSTQAIFQLTTNMVLTWRWTNEYYLSVVAGPNGTATVEKTGWYTNGVTVSGIGAGPDAGYMFSLWSGDVPQENDTDIPLSLLMNKARSIQANFASASGVDKLWTGNGYWENSARWSPSGMPGPNDRCYIGSGTAILAYSRYANKVVVSNGWERPQTWYPGGKVKMLWY